ncbi:MAG: AEC family transporter [Zoogloeaceae bacterium]|nr:AEC family transporter [Zoogloeaceae bacterium]
MQSLLILLPDFSLILLGVLLRRWMIADNGFWTGVERLVYFVLFPAMLFKALASVSIDMSTTLPLVGAGLTVMFSGFLLGLVGRPLMGLSGITFASRVQCAYRFNTYIAIAIAGKVHGAEGVALMGALCGMMVPFANIMAVGMLARHGQGGLVRELVRNPLVLATLAGLAFNLAGGELPQPANAFFGRLGDAAVALGLLAVGAALRWSSPGGNVLGLSWVVAVKLALLPAIAWWLGRQLGMDGIAFDLLVLFAAMPSASSAYILAMRMGGDGPGVAWLISATTVLAMPTLTVWLALL